MPACVSTRSAAFLTETNVAFRRRRDEWDDFLKLHAAELDLCGVPDHVLADKQRFFVFLEHGYDERGWAENPHACFDARI